MSRIDEVFIYDEYEKRMIPFSKWVRVPENEDVYYKEKCNLDFEHKKGVMFHIENENINIDTINTISRKLVPHLG